MSLGTPGFRGERLVEAREARGLSAIALSDLLPVTRAAISLYEKGTSTPSADVFEEICRVLRLPAAFFREPPHKKNLSTVFYRSLSATTKASRTRAERRFRWLLEFMVPYLADLVDWPVVNLPEFSIPTEPLLLFDSDIEDVATEVRRLWGLENRPVGNLAWLLENNGVPVSRGELEAESLDSFSAWVEEERPYVYINADSSSAVRERYDAAHELGHLILHRRLPKADFWGPQKHRLYENQAHRFAGAFLLPEATFLREIYTPTLNAFRTLKPKWMASIGAMIHRCEDLGFIEKDQATHLWRAYSRQGWRKYEPLDDKLEFEEPRLFVESMRLLLRGPLAGTDILSSVPLSAEDVEDLTGLERGELTGRRPMISIISRTGPEAFNGGTVL